MEWRFLAHASDDEPGFSTSWLRQQSLKRQADCREREYKKQALHGFAEEFGMTSALPGYVDQGVQGGTNGSEDDDQDDDDDDDGNAEEERDDIISSMENTPVRSRMASDISLFHVDRPAPPEVLVWLTYRHMADASVIFRLLGTALGRMRMGGTW